MPKSTISKAEKKSAKIGIVNWVCWAIQFSGHWRKQLLLSLRGQLIPVLNAKPSGLGQSTGDNTSNLMVPSARQSDVSILTSSMSGIPFCAQECVNVSENGSRSSSIRSIFCVWLKAFSNIEYWSYERWALKACSICPRNFVGKLVSDFGPDVKHCFQSPFVGSNAMKGES